jgi:hypothetical protein
MRMTKKLENKIDKMIKKFDFQRVKRTMECLDWHWGGNPNFPTIEELKKSAREHLMEVAEVAGREKDDFNPCWCSSGGFVAFAYVSEDNHLQLELSFNVESIDIDWV